ncbi:hypothetical protein CRE_18331 [Caenorhabditis remanei]|uniref:Uncharacterized protein n=1 Tax=Caenorhabditis remanei TaxID=31234 RepID=E3NQX8_CAERE|nr:hypothetical protein CRE_18331 [Caenorhabditis remanei]
MKSKLAFILIFLSLVMLSLADHSSESSDDDHSSKEDHSGDDPEDGKTDEDSGKNKEKEKNKKEDKNKDKHEEANYDDDEDSKLNTWDIDAAFVGTEPTKKPEEVDNSEKTTVEPLGGLFTPGPSSFWNEVFGNGGSGGKSDSSATSAPAETTETPKDDSENDNGGSPQGHEGTHGTVSGNPFYPYPRPVDVWDRLIVLAAFPICFFALMLKAEMFR